ncbi:MULTISPECIES: FecR domain-containing protein [unclassified Bradyrhizobium]|uniref:FecR domain-containing protein n=1 Tax=unclassified Bradyrhizobium TaxID=2631580 RepID=UPI002FF27196
MTMLARAGWIVFSSLLLTADVAAQPATLGCTTAPTAQGTQTLHCPTAITIVAESGAKFELGDRNRDGHVDSVELSNKALLLEVPKKPGRTRFNVVTPQAIAAVRGTKWAVDAEGAKTSVFVVNGRVSVARSAGRGSVVLGPGDGVDVEGSGELIVKRWPPARVTALMARLGQ